MADEPNIMLSCLLGEETWKNATYKFYVFGIHYPGRSSVKEAAISGHAKDTAISEVAKVRQHNVSASRESGNEKLGHWTAATYALKAGSILKVYAYKSTQWGGKPLIVNQLIRMRPDAPVNKLSLPLSQHDSAVHNQAHIMGRFDLLSVEEAKAYGAALNSRQERMYADNWSDSLVLEEIEAGKEVAETVMQKTVINSDGEEKKIILRRRKRAVD